MDTLPSLLPPFQPLLLFLSLSLSHSQKKKNKINILFMHRNPIPLKKSNQISPTPIKKEHSQGWPNLQVFLFPENLLCLFFIYFILHSACFQGKYGKVNENTIWVFFGGHEYDKNEKDQSAETYKLWGLFMFLKLGLYIIKQRDQSFLILFSFIIKLASFFFSLILVNFAKYVVYSYFYVLKDNIFISM